MPDEPLDGGKVRPVPETAEEEHSIGFAAVGTEIEARYVDPGAEPFLDASVGARQVRRKKVPAFARAYLHAVAFRQMLQLIAQRAQVFKRGL